MAADPAFQIVSNSDPNNFFAKIKLLGLKCYDLTHLFIACRIRFVNYGSESGSDIQGHYGSGSAKSFESEWIWI